MRHPDDVHRPAGWLAALQHASWVMPSQLHNESPGEREVLVALVRTAGRLAAAVSASADAVGPGTRRGAGGAGEPGQTSRSGTAV
jgi:hypothetical protein